MNTTTLRITGRGLWMHKRRLLGLVGAVFLGVAFLSGTLGLSSTMTSAVDASFTTAYRGIDVIVRNATATASGRAAARGPIDAALVDRVRGVAGVADARGEVVGVAAIAGTGGQLVTSTGPKTAGTWLGDTPMNPWRLVTGRAPQEVDKVVVDQGSATRGRLAVGQRTTVYVPDPVMVTVSGIATYGGLPTNGGGTYVAFTLAGAERYLLGGRDEVSDVLVRAEPGVSQTRLVTAIRAVLPPGTEAISGVQATSDQIAATGRDFLAYFDAFLGVFAGIALLVAMLSVHNSFAVVAASRESEWALLRTVGASRAQILGGQLVETAVLGIAGSAAGVAAGYGMAAGLKGVFAGVGFDLPASGVAFTGGNVLLSLAVGTGVTVLAGLWPAVRASRVPPLAALNSSTVDNSGSSRVRGWAGAALTVAGAGATTAAALTDRPAAMVAVAALATLAGVLVLGPVLAGWCAAVLGAPIARLRGVPGRLARRNTARSPKRTAAAATALTVGVTTVVLFTVLGASLKASMTGNADRLFTGDLVVSATARGYAGSGFSSQVATRIAALPGVRAAVGTGTGDVLVDGGPQKVTIADPAGLDRVFAIGAKGGELAVSTTTARDHHWQPGSRVSVTFADGATVAMTVGGLYPPVPALSDLVLPAGVWLAHNPQRLDTAVYVATQRAADAGAVTAAVSRVAQAFGGLTVQGRSAYLDSIAAGANPILDIVYVMLALAIVIALLGITNTLTLAVYERIREIGLLRAVGADKAQIRSTLRWEAVLTAVLGTLTGAALGVFLGWALVSAISATTPIGVTRIPWTQIAVILLAGAVAGLLAGARPARRATRLDPLAAIAAS